MSNCGTVASFLLTAVGLEKFVIFADVRFSMRSLNMEDVEVAKQVRRKKP